MHGCPGKHVLSMDGMGISDESMLDFEDVHLSELYSSCAGILHGAMHRQDLRAADRCSAYALFDNTMALGALHPHNGETEWLHRSPIDLKRLPSQHLVGYEVTLGESTTATTRPIRILPTRPHPSLKASRSTTRTRTARTNREDREDREDDWHRPSTLTGFFATG